MKQFEVYLVDLDPTLGAEMKKTRPAVVVSPDAMNKHLQTVIVAPLTHTVKNYPSRTQTTFNGQSGEIVLDQIRAVDKKRLIKKLGTIDKIEGENTKLILQTMFS